MEDMDFAAINISNPSAVLRVLRENPLICSCDLHWLQEWQRNERADLDSQSLFCVSNDQEVLLSSLVIDNCSESI